MNIIAEIDRGELLIAGYRVGAIDGSVLKRECSLIWALVKLQLVAQLRIGSSARCGDRGYGSVGASDCRRERGAETAAYLVGEQR